MALDEASEAAAAEVASDRLQLCFHMAKTWIALKDLQQAEVGNVQGGARVHFFEAGKHMDKGRKLFAHNNKRRFEEGKTGQQQGS